MKRKSLSKKCGVFPTFLMPLQNREWRRSIFSAEGGVTGGFGFPLMSKNFSTKLAPKVASKKNIAIRKTSKATATRDLQDLQEKKIKRTRQKYCLCYKRISPDASGGKKDMGSGCRRKEL